jgi:hypothetical protein
MSTLTAPRVPLRRVVLTCGAVLAAEVLLMLVMGEDWRATLLPGYAIILLAFGAAFCLGAVTVAGFVTGAAGAGLLLLGTVGLLPLLGGAAALALICGLAPGWSRVEAWQEARFQALTAAEEAAAARRTARSTVGRHRVAGPSVRITWRTDRVVAAFLVLAFPPAVAAFSLWFVDWVSSR